MFPVSFLVSFDHRLAIRAKFRTTIDPSSNITKTGHVTHQVMWYAISKDKNDISRDNDGGVFESVVDQKEPLNQCGSTIEDIPLALSQ